MCTDIAQSHTSFGPILVCKSICDTELNKYYLELKRKHSMYLQA